MNETWYTAHTELDYFLGEKLVNQIEIVPPEGSLSLTDFRTPDSVNCVSLLRHASFFSIISYHLCPCRLLCFRRHVNSNCYYANIMQNNNL